MLKRTVLSAVCAAALLVTGVYAQTSATLTLRSGEKVSGDLIDLGGVGYTIRVSGNERQIAQNDVAVIDFTGGTMSSADWAKFTGTSQVILRNGQTIDGSLYDIGGTNPLRLTLRTSSGEREISSNEVARIVIARPDNVATATSGIADTPSVAGAITVQANQPWTSTGITVKKGQRVTFTSTGEVQLSDNAADVATPDGAKDQRFAPNAPLKQVPAGALIGRVGNGAPFPIGANSQAITMPASGVLYLGINDDGFGDNRGNFQVVVR
ncbi:MAG TPA: hypothetical protein VEL51_16455 [Vicinamibacterales bacterium]|nr:hypothetical protein [Vicinamibacterales bacterium]